MIPSTAQRRTYRAGEVIAFPQFGLRLFMGYDGFCFVDGPPGRRPRSKYLPDQRQLVLTFEDGPLQNAGVHSQSPLPPPEARSDVA